MDKTWSSHTMEYYSHTKSNEVLIHTTIWTNLENTVNGTLVKFLKDGFYHI